ncbi:MAG: helix-turn-helix transcriptional regulator [Anaerolineae bacterium]|nr:helix-turn-helix transcriptional regulator [Anaerolineae bacterium]
MATLSSFKDLEQYLETRVKDFGHSMASLAEALGFSHAYISGIAQGHFRPSEKRCLKIAQFFNDDPHIILELAGFYVPETRGDGEVYDRLDRIIALLSEVEVAAVLQFAEFRKWVMDRARDQDNE